MYGGSILKLNWVRESMQPTLAVVYYSSWCGAEKIGYLMSMVSGEGGEKFQVPLENKKVKCSSHKP